MIIAAKSDPATTMKRNGKSFWFASLFLPTQVAADAARLYAFCRTMDDLADIAVTQESQATLAQVRSDLRSGTTSIPDVQDFLALADQYKLPCEAADYLIATFIQDATTELHVEDEDQLVRYCYGVAGTVGLMMSPILGAHRPQASEAAIHRARRAGGRQQPSPLSSRLLDPKPDSARDPERLRQSRLRQPHVRYQRACGIRCLTLTGTR
jgi:phytoene/squalene synthetase